MQEILLGIWAAIWADPLKYWSALLATVLGGIKLWEVLVRDRVRLATDYFWSTQDGAEDRITVVNHGSAPLMVASWSLAFEPKLFSGKGVLPVTPDFEPEARRDFTLNPHAKHDLLIYEPGKFEWNGGNADGRNLYLTLAVYGRSRPVRLKIK